jgi:hypothetical protein
VSAGDLLAGVVAGFVAAIIWTLVVWIYRWWRRKQDFGRLSGRYRITRKLAEEPEPQTVCISVSRNLLSVEFENLSHGGSASGEIAMNEQLPRSGEGHYSQVMEDGKLLWGFWNVEVKDNDAILVHQTYANPTTFGTVVVGEAWSRISE